MTANKYTLSNKISEKLKCSKSLAKLFINAFSDCILEEIADGNSVMIGSVAKLSVLEINSRKGINPSTKKEMIIPGKLRLKISAYRSVLGVLHKRYKDSK